MSKLFSTFLLLLLSFPAFPQEWPAKPVRWIIPYAAGGFSDIRARKIGVDLSRLLGQPVVIENRAGAGGVVGTDAVAKAAPDGYTIGMGNLAPLAVNVSLMKKLPYDPAKDVQAVVLLEKGPLILTAGPGLKANSVAELIAYAKANPGKVTFASSGIGGAHHLSGEMLRQRTGIDIVHIPYKGGAPAAADVMAGHVPMMFELGYAALPSVKAGKVRALAVTSTTRMALLRRADPRRSGIAGVRVNQLAGRHRAGRHAARDRRAAQPRHQRRPRDSRAARFHRRQRRRSRRRHARSLPRFHPQRNREVGRSRAHGEDPAGVTAQAGGSEQTIS